MHGQEPFVVLSALGLILSIKVVNLSSHSFKYTISVEPIFKGFTSCQFLLFLLLGQAFCLSCFLFFLLRSFLSFFAFGCSLFLGLGSGRSWLALGFGVSSGGLGFTLFFFLLFDSSLELFVASSSNESLRLYFFALLRLKEVLHGPVV